MPESSPADIQFLNELHDIIAKNMANEQFGVTELADAMNMSRSNLLRKVKKSTDLPVNQLIREVRLKRAMELLQNSASNVSEVSHQVGFNSASYFIKCFREYYGFSPGEAARRSAIETPQPLPYRKTNLTKIILFGLVAGVLLLLAIAFYYYKKTAPNPLERSIVVLPFKNESNDSTNIYIINGLMESTLNNLQKIEDLRVLSRTSSEKYRNTAKSIPEMATELNVNYFVEGSGQKIGDQILLNIQLIEGHTDKHVWAKQYRREAKDIFDLQQEIAKNIAEEIQVIIRPEEKQRIEKIPTENLEAYDSFLKGIDLMIKGGDENLEGAIKQFDDAIKKDNSFAHAYACAGIACYYLDIFKSEKTHIDALGNYADKALLYDSKLSESLMAKGMYYLLRREYDKALPHLEKGLEYNPNSVELVGLLADFYTMYQPNTGKYLEFALRGLRLDAGSGDSVSVSNFHLRLANALAQTGFIDKSLEQIEKALEINSNNHFARYLKAFVVYAKKGDLHETKQLLLTEFNKDTTRFDILQDIAKVSFYLKEYDSAYRYYKRFNHLRETFKLEIYRHENLNIGLVYKKAGDPKAKAFIDDYRLYMENDQTAYKDLGLSAYYQTIGEPQKALEHLKRFSKEDNIQYWIILFMRQDPLPGGMNSMPECKKILDEIEAKFWANHRKLKLTLEEKGLL